MRVGYELIENMPPRIGLIALQSDETIEADMRRLLPETVELLVSRVPSATHVTPETLAAMESALAHAAGLMPRAVEFAAVGYGCTSGTAQIGARGVAEAVRAGTRTAHVTEPLSAVIAACRHLGLRRIGLLSPYIESVSARLRAGLAAAGIEVCAFASFEEGEEEKVVRIAPHSIIAAAEALAAKAPMEALFISCTNLRTLAVIDAIEARLGVPVLSSNQALAWHLLQLAGVEKQTGAYGVLMRKGAQTGEAVFGAEGAQEL